MLNSEQIVIIDDSQLMLMALSNILSPYYPVHCFNDVEEGLEKIPSINPALILLDVIMPKMSGFDAIKIIKATHAIEEIPVIMMTAQKDKGGGEHEVQCFMSGAVDFVQKPYKPQVVLARVRSHVELYESRRELEKTSVTDALTGIRNRRGFNDAFGHEWGRSFRKKTNLSLCLIDIDYFKLYNDNYGHQEGDNALHLVGQAVNNSLLRATDIAARYGGEEFAVILPDTDAEGSVKVAEALNQAIRNLNIPHGHSAAEKIVTVSIGVATSMAIQEGEDLIKAADEMLYEAKKAGRNRFCHTTI